MSDTATTEQFPLSPLPDSKEGLFDLGAETAEPIDEARLPQAVAASIIDTNDITRAREAIAEHRLYQGIVTDPPHTSAEQPEYSVVISDDFTLTFPEGVVSLTHDQTFVLNLLLVNRGRNLRKGDFIRAGFRADSRSDAAKDTLLARARKQLARLGFPELGSVLVSKGESPRDASYGLDPRVVFVDQRQTTQAASVADLSDYHYQDASVEPTAKKNARKASGRNRTTSTPADPLDPVRLYLDDMGQVPLLDRDDEIRLAQARDQGLEAGQRLSAEGQNLSTTEQEELRRQVADGEAATKQFVEANLRLVVSMAKKFQVSGMPLLDLIQFGNEGLMRAVEKFEWQRGFKFSTYAAWWIRQSIGRGIANELRLIRLPVNLHEQVGRMRREMMALEGALNHEPTINDLAESLHTSPDHIKELLTAEAELHFIDAPVSDESEATQGDLVADPRSSNGYDDVERRMMAEQIHKALAICLDYRERQIMTYRQGFLDGKKHSLAETGKYFGMTHEMARQIEHCALAKLRHPSSPARKLLADMI